MDRLNNNKGTPSKETGSVDIGTGQNTHTEKERTAEYERPNPSTATPTIPSEMPAREIK